MAIEFFDGFELGQLSDWTMTGSGVVSISSLYARNGRYGFNNTAAATLTLTLSLTSTVKKTAGTAMWFGTSALSSTSLSILSFRNAGTTHVGLYFNSNGQLELRQGSRTGTLLATSTNTFGAAPVSQWRYFELQVSIHDTTGTAIARVDGVEWINYTGDTRNGATTTINEMSIVTASTGASVAYWDDVYVLNDVDATATTGRPDNTFLGDIKVEPLIPNVDGQLNQWLGSDGNNVQNYLLVDEAPVNTSDYTGSANVGERDMWGVTDVAAGSLSVLGVQVGTYMSKSDAGSAGIKILHRDSSGTIVSSNESLLSQTWLYYVTPRYLTKPSGGAWTVAEANALQIGVERTS